MAKANIDTKQAISEINNLINTFNVLIKTTGEVSTVSQGNFRKVETALNGLKSVSLQAANAFDKMNAAQQQAVLIAQQEASAMNSAAIATRNAASATKTQETNTKAATSAVSGLVGGLKTLVSAFGLVSGVQIFAGLIKNAFSLMKTFDSVSFALKTIEKDAFQAAESQRFLLEVTQDYGVELVATTQRWIRFLAAAKQSNITLKDTEQIFRSVTKAGAVLGLQTEDLQTVYLALEQMLSKGKVTTEELRRQLGEKLPGAVGIMAAAIGVSVEELDKMLKKGEVLSAEVLPKFARALESAYGIETIEKIDTLTASQNTLTNAWELFVKSVSENKGAVAGGINLVTMSIKGLLAALTPAEVLEQQKYDQTIIENKKKFTKMIMQDAKARLDGTLAIGSKYDDIDKQAKEAVAKYQAAIASGNSAELEQLQKQMKDKIAIRNSYDERIEADTHARAIMSLESNQKRYDEETAQVKKWQDELLDNQKHWYRAINKHSDDELKDLISKARGRQAAAAAALEVSKLNAEVALPFKPEEEKKKKVIPKKYLDEIKDLTNEEKIARLNSQKEINDAILRAEESSADDIMHAMIENGDFRLQIADIEYAEALEKAKDYHDKQKTELTRAIAEGKKIIGDQDKYLREIDKNYKDQVAIANTNHNKKKLENERAFNEDLKDLIKKTEDDKIRIVDNSANKQIIAAKKTYDQSSKTAKDKAKLDEVLNKIAVDQANAIIDIQIETLRGMKEMSGVTEEVVAQIENQILKLEAAKKQIFPEKDSKEQYKKLTETLELLKEVAQATQDIGDAIFNRRIENINAEIQAEEDKYDRLIGLAKNNKDEQLRLQTEKEAKIKELEAKRLKEEQKRAKFDKANALVQIAINTAVAISKVLSQTGIFGLAAWIPIAALGAVQAAAVLAQPIPKYKEGLKKAPKDHIGMINDGKDQEFVERDGSILTTKTKNAIINLKKGDKVHKSYEDMVNGSDMFQNLSRSILLNNLSHINNDQALTMELMMADQFKNIQKDIKKGIHDGFNKVTINNYTKIDMDWIRYKNDTL